MAEAAKEWHKREFEIGKTYFKVRKMLSMEAFVLLEQIRAMVGRGIPLIGSVPAGSSPEAIIGTMLLSISPEDMERVRHALFRDIQFRNEVRKTWTYLTPEHEGAAFQELGPVKVYEVIARSFAVNFTESWEDFESLMDLLGLEESTPPPNPPTSPESSPEGTQ